MKVYVGYSHYYNHCDEFKAVKVIFDSEEKAEEWVDRFYPTENEWRTYEEWKLNNEY